MKKSITINIKEIEKWVEKEIMFYDPDDFEWNYLVDQAVSDMFHNFLRDFDLEDDTIENEQTCRDYLKKEWEEFYQE